MTIIGLFKAFILCVGVVSYPVTEAANERPSDKQPLMIAEGHQPQFSKNSKGQIRLVFGRNDSIFCANLSESGNLSTTEFVAEVQKMHLGMGRGPQIAVSGTTAMITAMDKAGDIYSFLYEPSKKKWIRQEFVNDLRNSAPEGLMSVAADDNDHYYAVWLDTRKEKHNQLFMSSFSVTNKKWSKNNLVYASPDKHVCECCKPSIAVKEKHVAIMFRNWLNGSRDMYLTESYDKGISFGKAMKLGTGSWKLDGCPMDGGGVVIDEKNITHTAWQREGFVYYCKKNEEEQKILKGRTCSISTGNGKIIVTLQDAGNVKVYDVMQNAELTIGKGGFLKTIFTKQGAAIAAWEQDGQIKIAGVSRDLASIK